jgi:uncharacterized membrane protein
MIAGCVGFIFIHLAVSGTPIRQLLIRMMGEGAYLGTYSLLSLITLGLMITGYGQLDHSDFVWLPDPMAYKVTKVLVLIALLFLVMGAFTRNPTAVKSEQALEEEISGMLKITRHPIQWGILLFCVAHVISNGDTNSLIFFGTLISVSFLGMLAMDNRHGAEESPQWRTFMENTSMFPFMAMIGGKTRFTIADISWPGLAIAVLIYIAAYFFHGYLSGGISLI